MFDVVSPDCITVMLKVDTKINAIKGLVGGFEDDARGWQGDDLERTTAFTNVSREGSDTVVVSVGEHYRRPTQRQLNIFQLRRGRPRGATNRFGGAAVRQPRAVRTSQAKPILRPEMRDLLMERLRERAGAAIEWRYAELVLGV